ncbi:hypothetical protein DH2020_016186 [Rehmannia glutinosa]|uniref:Uncharacterized protein n=1 Tax=Rehmannia glutinosa TaxID=99300 RepID=A0ABR0WVT1_REHGL
MYRSTQKDTEISSMDCCKHSRCCVVEYSFQLERRRILDGASYPRAAAELERAVGLHERNEEQRAADQTHHGEAQKPHPPSPSPSPFSLAGSRLAVTVYHRPRHRRCRCLLSSQATAPAPVVVVQQRIERFVYFISMAAKLGPNPMVAFQSFRYMLAGLDDILVSSLMVAKCVEIGFFGADPFGYLFSVIVWIYAHVLTVGGAYNGAKTKTQASYVNRSC